MRRYFSIILLLVFSGFVVFGQPGRKKINVFEGKGEVEKPSNAVDINTVNVDFSPAYYQNGIVYVSQHKSGPVDEKSGQTFFELFYSELDPNGVPQKPQNFSLELNSQFHEGPVTFNRKGDRIFFTRSNTKGGISKADKKGRVVLKIYEADRGVYDWENIRELPFNNDDYSCMHPSLSPDGHKLFFASDMPGGYGGMDLYFSERRNGSWSPPINLGPDINTDKNEVFPFFHESGTLFFASNGHQGYGGLDLFEIDMSQKKWGEVYNLGKPYNSVKDDLGIILNESGDAGFFTSNRKRGKGKDDIYYFRAKDGIRGVEAAPNKSVEVRVIGDGSNHPIKEAGIYAFELSPTGLLKNDQFYDVEFLGEHKFGEEMTIRLKRKANSDLGAPSWVTDARGKAILGLQPNQKYLVIIKKSGFALQEVVYDASDSTPINIQLKQNHCLTLTGKIKSKKYQVTLPNVTVSIRNENDGTIKKVKTNLSGNFDVCLPFGGKYNISCQKKGFVTEETSLSTENSRGSRSKSIDIRMQPVDISSIKEPIKKGTVFVLENIYYDFNKSAIRKGDAPDLEALTSLMKQYPSMEIELGAHTDSRGSDEYNLKLSLKRAESAKAFLVNKGIDSDRIQAFGYGEAFPRNKCVDGVECSDEAYQYNRRTQVKVLKINELEARHLQD